MSFDITDLIGSRVASLEPYAPEPPESVAQRLGMPVGQLIKLDANENPYGPTQGTLNALTAHREYHIYPDAISRRLRQAIGQYLHVDPATVLVGNGSDELIDLILRLFRPSLQGGGIGQVIDCPPTFGMYAFYGTTNDMQVISFPRDAAFQIDLPAIEKLCARDPRPKALFLTTPNNPDGQLLPEGQLRRVLDLPLLVVLDEAYIEFGGASHVDWVAERQNLIVLRTFSKWAGLAGLRVGYGVFPTVLMDALWRLKSPYNVNGLAQAAALATLQDMEQAQENMAKIVAERQQLVARLRAVPYLQVYDSQANFVLCRLRGRPVATVRVAMEKRGIMLRYYGSAGLEDCVRISVGTPMQDAAVLMVLRELV
jgi:histidinol-phosphate aminotransferase